MKAKVLIVEDSADIRESLQDLLVLLLVVVAPAVAAASSF